MGHGHEAWGKGHQTLRFFLIPHSSCLIAHSSCLMPHASCLIPHASCLAPHASCLHALRLMLAQRHIGCSPRLRRWLTLN